MENPGKIIDTTAVPTIDELMDIIEDLCVELNIKRMVIYIDEARHMFLFLNSKDNFFNFFREIRSSYVKM